MGALVKEDLRMRTDVIPHLDPLGPPDISCRNYCGYLEKKRKFIGKR